MSSPLKVLIALDGSHFSDVVVDWAIENFINPEKHAITLFSVVTSPVDSGLFLTGPAVTMYSTTFLEEVEQKAVAQTDEVLRKAKSKIVAAFQKQPASDSDSGSFGHGIRMARQKGEPRDLIVDFANDIHADVLLIGSRGMGAFKRTFLGSVSDYCIHHVPCPVIVVKEPEAKHGSNNKKHQQKLRILVALDQSSINNQNLLLKKTNELFNGKNPFVIVSSIPELSVDPASSVGFYSASFLSECKDEAIRAAIAAMECPSCNELAVNERVLGNPTCHSSIGKELLSIAEKNSVDLIVLKNNSSHQGILKSILLGSVSTFVARNANLPVLIIK